VGSALLAHLSVRQKPNRVSSVQLCHSLLALTASSFHAELNRAMQTESPDERAIERQQTDVTDLQCSSASSRTARCGADGTAAAEWLCRSRQSWATRQSTSRPLYSQLHTQHNERNATWTDDNRMQIAASDDLDIVQLVTRRTLTTSDTWLQLPQPSTRSLKINSVNSFKT